MKTGHEFSSFPSKFALESVPLPNSGQTRYGKAFVRCRCKTGQANQVLN